MIYTIPEEGKKAILVTYPTRFAINEALDLAWSAGYTIVRTVSQKNITRSKFGIGKGKAEEVKAIVVELNIDVIIFDEILKPSQQYNLARLCKVEVVDREKLILEIFLERATTNESKIQVKLAQLKYDIVRVKEKTRLAKLGEQPGFYGLGKYDADIHLLDIKRRTTLLKKKLKTEEKKRALHRVQRLNSNLPLIALAGYTSAGKTTLFNLLSEEKKNTSETVFTTLTTYTRSFFIEDRKVLISDTIGFISRLPPYMIEAFKSTLSELNYADIILLLIDISEDSIAIRKKFKRSLEILSRLELPLDKCVLVLNKIDRVRSNEIREKLSDLVITKGMSQVVSISAELGYNISGLQQIIEDRIKAP